eukprot:850521-Rhodomonas_salina.1
MASTSANTQQRKVMKGVGFDAFLEEFVSDLPLDHVTKTQIVTNLHAIPETLLPYKSKELFSETVKNFMTELRKWKQNQNLQTTADYLTGYANTNLGIQGYLKNWYNGTIAKSNYFNQKGFNKMDDFGQFRNISLDNASDPGYSSSDDLPVPTHEFGEHAPSRKHY